MWQIMESGKSLILSKDIGIERSEVMGFKSRVPALRTKKGIGFLCLILGLTDYSEMVWEVRGV